MTASAEQIILDLRGALVAAGRRDRRDDLSALVVKAIDDLVTIGAVSQALRVLRTMAGNHVLTSVDVRKVFGASFRSVELFRQAALELFRTPGFARHFQSDETNYRGLLHAAFAPRHPLAPDLNAEICATAARLAGPIAACDFPDGVRVSSRWRGLADDLAAAINLMDSAHHLILLGAYYGGFKPMSYAPDSIGRHQIQHFRNIRSKGRQRGYIDLDRLSELSLLEGPATEDVDGALHSANSAVYAAELATVADWLPADERIATCLEIGSGYGGFARMVKLGLPQVAYFLVDIPESLAIAYAYLQLGFPEARCLVVEDVTQFAVDWWRGYDFIFCPMQLYGRIPFPPIDLGFNFWSLGEMNQGCVDYFLGRLNHDLSCRRFVFWNSVFQDRDLLNEASTRDGEGCLATLKFGRAWRPRHASFESNIGSSFDPMVERDIYRNNVLVMMERVGDDDIDAGWETANPVDGILQLYLRALWFEDAGDIAAFVSGLRHFLALQDCSRVTRYAFEALGEVRYFSSATEAL